ncbi:hypothetical protein BT69DRAFT_1287194 [Atractiella rhizophila]|nr:hypothetical protein BT69DRAFT_1287194 [Atractiella rhizophila]
MPLPDEIRTNPYNTYNTMSPGHFPHQAESSSSTTSGFNLPFNTSAATTATEVTRSSMANLPESSNAVGLPIQFNKDRSGIQNGKILSDMLNSVKHTPSVQSVPQAQDILLALSTVRFVKAHRERNTVLRFTIDHERQPLYGAVRRSTQRPFAVTLQDYQRLQGNDTYLTFSLTEGCPRVWLQLQQTEEEIYPWTEFDLWLKAVAAHIGYCSSTPKLSSREKNATERPSTLCKHFDSKVVSFTTPTN